MSLSLNVNVRLLAAVLPFLAVGCASVPDVESRLKNMQIAPHTYVAQPGDTIETVAFRYQLAPEQLIAMNPHLSTGMLVGERVAVHEPPVGVGPIGVDAGQAGSVVAYNARPQVPNVQGSHAVTQPGRKVITSGAINGTPVTVQPGASSVTAAVTYPTETFATPEGSVAFDQIKEIPANAIASVGARMPVEEVIPDSLDYDSLPAATDEQLLTTSLESRTVNAPTGNPVGGWVWPTWGEVARDFAPGEAGGQGIDIAGVPGQEIHAVSSGTVAYAGRELSGGEGKLIILRHNNGLMTTYSHAQQLFVAEDDIVGAGDVIASLGANNRNESVLRFEVRKDGNPLNPMNFLAN